MTTLEPKTLAQLDDFTRGYILAMFWTNDDDASSGEYSTSGRPEEMFAKLAPEALAQCERDCKAFYADCGHLWCDTELNNERADHDFWLSRNHHGTGFFDSDYLPDDIRSQLQDESHKAGERDLYLGDDGKLYIS